MIIANRDYTQTKLTDPRCLTKII